MSKISLTRYKCLRVLNQSIFMLIDVLNILITYNFFVINSNLFLIDLQKSATYPSPEILIFINHCFKKKKKNFCQKFSKKMYI